MAGASLKPDDFPRWFGNLAEQAARRAMLSTAERIVSIILNELIPAENPEPSDIGTFRAGWRVDPTADGAFIVNTAPHAVFLENGVRAENVKPGKAMHDALVEWVIRKNIGDPQEASQIAWAIMTAMTKRGIFKGGEGFHFLDRAMKRLPEIWATEFAREMNRAMR